MLQYQASNTGKACQKICECAFQPLACRPSAGFFYDSQGVLSRTWDCRRKRACPLEEPSVSHCYSRHLHVSGCCKRGKRRRRHWWKANAPVLTLNKALWLTYHLYNATELLWKSSSLGSIPWRCLEAPVMLNSCLFVRFNLLPPVAAVDALRIKYKSQDPQRSAWRPASSNFCSKIFSRAEPS